MKTERTRAELYWDLETIPSQDPAVRNAIAAAIEPPGNISKAETIAKWHAETKPVAVDEAWRKTALNGGRGHIAVIGYAFDDEAPEALWSPTSVADEAAIITHFYSVLQKRSNNGRHAPRMIGYNCVAFDLRFLLQRSIVLGIEPPAWMPFEVKPWESDKVLDVAVAWSGVKGMEKMDDVCTALGIAGKGDIDGSKVWDYVAAGRIEEVADYCKGDVTRTREIHYRVEFRGRVQARASVLREVVGAE